MTHTLTRKYIVFFIIAFGFLGILAGGCGNPKKVVYFNDLPDSASYLGNINSTPFTAIKLKPDDIISISIQTLDPQSSQIFSGQATATGSTSATAGSTGFLIDKDGYIEMPLVGKTKLSGLTLGEAREQIRQLASRYYKDPIVNVRLANFQVTVLGEVNRPGTIVMPKEQVGLIDVIGLAGDLTQFGKRDNILVIREGDRGKEFMRLNVNSSEVFKSPYYYIMPGDIIYVEPNKVKARTATTDYTRDRYITYTATGISLLLTIINFIRNSTR